MADEISNKYSVYFIAGDRTVETSGPNWGSFTFIVEHLIV